MTQELREINVNLTKEEESFLNFTPKGGEQYRVIDHIKRCKAEHEEDDETKPTDSAVQTRTTKIRLRINTFFNKRSITSFIGGFFKFLEFLSGLMEAALGAINSDYVIGFKVMMLIVKVGIAKLFTDSQIRWKSLA